METQAWWQWKCEDGAIMEQPIKLKRATGFC